LTCVVVPHSLHAITTLSRTARTAGPGRRRKNRSRSRGRWTRSRPARAKAARSRSRSSPTVGNILGSLADR
jgi:hypothetical protein